MEALKAATDTSDAVETTVRQVRELQQQWRQAADVPRAQGAALWQRFKTAHDQVWARCQVHFAAQAVVGAENLQRKIALCERAEALSDSTRWIQTADEIKALQAEWKTIGPVSRGQEKAVWERFRAACDRFFSRRHEDLAQRKTVWAENFARKDALCANVEALADSTDGIYTNFPDGTYRFDTIEFAYNKRLSQKFFVQASADYQWRNDFRSALPGDRRTSPLDADPIAINLDLTPNAAVPNRQKTTTYHLQFMGRYTLPYDVGFSANYRYQSGFPYSRVIPDCGCLNLSNFGADFFVEPLSNNRSDNVGLLNFRVDKGVKVGRAKISAMLDIYNVMNADPVTNFNLNTGAAFKRVIAVLDPRVFQKGFRLEF
jgi:hypothetical protein